MAQIDKYKNYSRGERKILIEENFSRGILSGELPLPEGYCRNIVNYNVDSTGLALVPRRGLESYDSLVSSKTNWGSSHVFLVIKTLLTLSARAGTNVVSERLVRFLLWGAPTSVTDFFVAPDGGYIHTALFNLNGVNINLDDVFVGLSSDAEMLLQCIMGPDDFRVHSGLGSFIPCPYLLHAVILNRCFVMTANGLAEFDLSVVPGYPLDTAELNCTLITPRKLNTFEATSYGFNMLDSDPFYFINSTGGSWHIFGVMPYKRGEKIPCFNYTPGQDVDFLLNYQCSASPVANTALDLAVVSGKPSSYTPINAPTVYLKSEIKDHSGNEWEPIKRYYWATAYGSGFWVNYTDTSEAMGYRFAVEHNAPLEVIEFWFKPFVNDFYLRCNFSYVRFTPDAFLKLTVLVLAYNEYNEEVQQANWSSVVEVLDLYMAEDWGWIDPASGYPGDTHAKYAFPSVEGYNLWYNLDEGWPGSYGFMKNIINNPAGAYNFINVWNTGVISNELNYLIISHTKDSLAFLKKYGMIEEFVLSEGVYLFPGSSANTNTYGTLRNIEMVAYDLKTAKGMLSWKKRLLLWGVSGAASTIFTSDIERPWYFPFPNNLIVYDKPILGVFEYLDSLLVITATTIYKTVLNSDGLGFSTEVAVDGLRFASSDIYTMLVVKNMLFFKSGNYYYMLVPDKKVLNKDALIVAPISNSITSLLDNFDMNLRDILFDMYSDVFPGVDFRDLDAVSLIPEDYRLDFVGEVVRVQYVFLIELPDSVSFRISFVLEYDVIKRVWTTDLFEVDKGGLLLLDVTSAGEPIFGCFTYTPTAAINYFKESTTSTEDTYLTTPLLPARQYLDTGFRNISSGWKKRFREVQLKINDPLSVPLNFQLGFAVDNVVRDNLQAESFGSTAFEDTPRIEYDKHWDLGEQNLSASRLDTCSCGVSGLGFLPRLKILSTNVKTHGILALGWVFRKLNAR